MPRIHSPLRYPGGKAAFAPILSEFIALNELEQCTFVEPFAGGAGASLALLFSENVERVIVNDLDRSLFAFWASVLDDTSRFLDRIENTAVTMSEWERQHAIYIRCDDEEVSQLDLGFAAFFLNRCNRSGIIAGGGPIGGRSQSGRWTINARFNKADLLRRIRRISRYRSRIDVSGSDALDLLRSATGHRREGRSFYFLDPPYYEKGRKLYLNSYEAADHEELAAFLLNEMEDPWVLTYDDVPQIRELYEDLCPRTWMPRYSAHRSRLGREMVVWAPGLKAPDGSLV